MSLPDFDYEKKFWKQNYDFVAGVDEVGRGALAGPTVASACAFAPSIVFRVREANREGIHDKYKTGFFLTGSKNKNSIIINDSKKLTAKQRERADEWIRKNCLAFGIGEADVGTINKIGIGKANRLAMRRAIRNFKLQTSHVNSNELTVQASFKKVVQKSKIFVLVDGYRVKYLAKDQKGIVHGDAKCFSIAAASIIAKVYRDKLMCVLGKGWKMYSWKKNKGYGTGAHLQAIKTSGRSHYHRNWNY